MTLILYEYTGSYDTFTVPSGVTEILVSLRGAAGGDSWPDYLDAVGHGGDGATVNGIEIPVTPGEVLRIYSGGLGASATAGAAGAGGWNGGGDGGYVGPTGTGYAPSGGGGGATDIRRYPYGLSDRLAVAGGGGGAGANGSGGSGGNGGHPSGGPGSTSRGGGGGTASAGGAGGSGSVGNGTAGTFGAGGDGAAVSIRGGGGGGGGYYGGGGGGEGGPGTQGGGGFGTLEFRRFATLTQTGVVCRSDAVSAVSAGTTQRVASSHSYRPSSASLSTWTITASNNDVWVAGIFFVLEQAP